MKNLYIIGSFILFLGMFSNSLFAQKTQITQDVYLISETGKFGLVDAEGDIIAPLVYDAIKFEGQRGWTMKDRKIGMINLEGQVIIPNEYEIIEFEGNLGFSRKNGKYGLIDLDGNILLPHEYDSLQIEKNQVRVLKDGKVKLIPLGSMLF